MADSIFSDVTGELSLKTIDAGLILHLVAIVVVAYLLTTLLSYILSRFSERAGVYRQLVTLFIPLLKIFIYTVALYLFITALIEPSVTQLIAFAGLFGAVVGIGLKDLFSDLAGGIVIILEKPFQIGDKVTMGNYYGEVKDIKLRSTRIQTPADELVSVPNNTIFTQSVNSGNAGDIAMMIVIDLFIDSMSDAAHAAKILKEALVTSKYVIISEQYPYTILIEDFPCYTRVRAKGYVYDLRLEFEFKSEVTRRALAEFKRSDIKLPLCYPGLEGLTS